MATSVLGGIKSSSEKKPADLQGTLEEIEQKVPPEMQNNYDRVIMAGSELLWGDQTHDVLVNNYIKRHIKDEKDIPKGVAEGIAQLVGIIIRKSGLRPEEIAAPAMVASQVLMLHVLIYLQQNKKFSISNRLLAETSHATTKAMFKLFGVTKDKFKATIKAMHERAKAQENQEEMPEGEEEVPFEEGQELPPDEEEVPQEEVPQEEVPQEEVPQEEVAPPPAEAGAQPPLPEEQPTV